MLYHIDDQEPDPSDADGLLSAVAASGAPGAGAVLGAVGDGANGNVGDGKGDFSFVNSYAAAAAQAASGNLPDPSSNFGKLNETTALMMSDFDLDNHPLMQQARQQQQQQQRQFHHQHHHQHRYNQNLRNAGSVSSLSVGVQCNPDDAEMLTVGSETCLVPLANNNHARRGHANCCYSHTSMTTAADVETGVLQPRHRSGRVHLSDPDFRCQTTSSIASGRRPQGQIRHHQSFHSSQQHQQEQQRSEQQQQPQSHRQHVQRPPYQQRHHQHQHLPDSSQQQITAERFEFEDNNEGASASAPRNSSYNYHSGSLGRYRGYQMYEQQLQPQQQPQQQQQQRSLFRSNTTEATPPWLSNEHHHHHNQHHHHHNNSTSSSRFSHHHHHHHHHPQQSSTSSTTAAAALAAAARISLRTSGASSASTSVPQGGNRRYGQIRVAECSFIEQASSSTHLSSPTSVCESSVETAVPKVEDVDDDEEVIDSPQSSGQVPSAFNVYSFDSTTREELEAMSNASPTTSGKVSTPPRLPPPPTSPLQHTSTSPLTRRRMQGEPLPHCNGPRNLKMKDDAPTDEEADEHLMLLPSGTATVAATAGRSSAGIIPPPQNFEDFQSRSSTCGVARKESTGQINPSSQRRW